jgi:hypothetical protein
MLPTIATGNVSSSLGGGYEVANSCRFNDGDSAYMHKTPGSAGNRRTFTFSCWIKRGVLGIQTFFSSYNADDATRPDGIRFSADDRLYVNFRNTEDAIVSTARLFRDVSAWYHICVAVDTTQGVAANRVKIYINGGSVETSLTGDGAVDSASYMAQNFECGGFNRDSKHQIGSRAIGTPTLYFDGYMAEVCFIDGSALTPTSFGEFDEDSPTIWKPKDVSGLTFGTNGFYLDFEDSANLGNDANGGTDLTEVNLAATDQATDTPTNNFATLNPLGMPSTNTTFSEGNLTVNVASGSSFFSIPTIGVSSGKWYVEGKLVTGTVDGGLTYSDYGFADRSDSAGQSLYSSSARVFWLSAWDSKINYRTGGSTTAGLQTGKTGLSQGDFFQLYLDMDNELMYWGRNGSVTNSTGISFNGKESLTGEYFFAFGDQFTSGTYKYSTNFGQGSIDGAAVTAYSDANGYGSFKYNPTVTTDEGSKDFLALCTKNLGAYGG